MAIALPFGLGRRKAPSAGDTIGVTLPKPRGQVGDFDEVGAVGTVFYSGFLDGEEYDSDLKGLKAVEVYSRMENDSTVQSMLSVLTLPLRGAIAKFEPASDSAQDVHIANACDEALLGTHVDGTATGMKGQLWDDFLRQGLKGPMQFGHAVFEKVYGTPDGKPNLVQADGEQVLAPYKLAPRLQKTLYRWHIDRYGELKGVQQRAFVGSMDSAVQIEGGDTGGSFAYGSSGSYHYIDLPASRILYIGIDRQGSNFLGRSVLRSAYKNWWYKDVHLRIQAVASERHGVGVPYAIVKQGIRADERAAIVNMLRTLHAHEKGYMLVSEAQIAKAQDVGMPPIGIMDMRATSLRSGDSTILYHDRQMALSILADFLTLGSGVGGNANVMHRDKRSNFFMALLGYKRPFEDAYQQQVVKEFVDLNWGPQKSYPRFGLGGLETKDSELVGRSLALMTQAGLLTPTAETEQQLRSELDLPPLPLDPEGNPIYPAATQEPITINKPMGGVQPRPRGTGPTQPEKPEAQPLDERPHTYADLLGSTAAEALQRKTAAQIQENAQRLADEGDDYDEEGFVGDSHSTLRDAFLGAIALGLAGKAAASAKSEEWAGQAADAQEPFLETFANDIAAQSLTPEAIDARAALYAGQVWTGYQRGRVDAMPSSGGRGRQEQGPLVMWHAEGDAGTCQLCDDRDGEVYTEDDLPGFPGEGDFGEICEGGPNCRCWLEMVDRGDLSEHKPAPVRILAEARCWQCKERGRPKTGTLLGHNQMVGSTAYCSNCRQLVEVRA